MKPMQIAGVAVFVVWVAYTYDKIKATVAGGFAAMIVGRRINLPPKARFYGCVNWKTVESIEAEAVTGGEMAAKGLLLRHKLQGECALVDPGENVLIVALGFSKYQFRKDGKDYWSPKAY